VGEQGGEGEDGEQTEVEEEGEEASDAEMDAEAAELSPTIDDAAPPAPALHASAHHSAGRQPTIDDAAPPAETFTSPAAHPISVMPAMAVPLPAAGYSYGVATETVPMAVPVMTGVIPMTFAMPVATLAALAVPVYEPIPIAIPEILIARAQADQWTHLGALTRPI
jgi:hypothetical protein